MGFTYIGIVSVLLVVFHVQHSITKLNAAVPNSSFEEASRFKMIMPNITTTTYDQHIVASFPLDFDEKYITGFDPVNMHSTTVHHVIMFGCAKPARKYDTFWRMRHDHDVCHNVPLDELVLLWTWALDSPTYLLPSGVGIRVGQKTDIKYIMMQLHYHKITILPDASQVDVLLTKLPPSHLAGVFSVSSQKLDILPGIVTKEDFSCRHDADAEIIPFGVFFHTHNLGRYVSAWRVRAGIWTALGGRDPQLPEQYCTPVTYPLSIRKGDDIKFRCTYDSRNVTEHVIWGHKKSDEMCMVYVMYKMPRKMFRYIRACLLPDRQNFSFPYDAETVSC